MHGTSSVRRPVALLLVDGEAQPHVLVVDDARLPLAAAVGHEGRVQRGHVVQGADDRVPDDVGEADLGPRGPGQLVVQDQAVDLEEPGRHRPHAGRRGHRQAGLHVGHDPRGRAAQRGGLLGPRRHDGRRGAGAAAAGTAAPVSGSSVGRAARCRCLGLRGGNRGGPVVGEELPPAVADRVGIGQEAVVHVVDQPGIGAERASCTAELGHGSTLPAAIGSHGQSG